jgi:hypothetical protein
MWLGGRKMLSLSVHVSGNAPAGQGTLYGIKRALKGAHQWDPFKVTAASSNANAMNNGYSAGGTMANSLAAAMNEGGSGGPSLTAAKSTANAMNNGWSGGPTTANSIAIAKGR